MSSIAPLRSAASPRLASHVWLVAVVVGVVVLRHWEFAERMFCSSDEAIPLPGGE